MSNDSSNTPLTDDDQQAKQGVMASPIKETPKSVYAHVPWSPWVAVAYATLVYLLAQFAASLLVYAIPQLFGHSKSESLSLLENNEVAQFLFILAAEIITVGAIWWFVRLRRSSLRAIGWRWPRWSDPLYTLAGFGVYFLGYAVVLAVTHALVPDLNMNQKQELGFNETQTAGLGLALTFIALVVLPPLAEEIVFRGFVFTGIRNKLKPWGAAIITSALFATAHLQFGSGKPLLWTAAIDTFTLSLVLCYLRHKTDSLWPGILLHALKNGIAFVGLFLLHQ